MKKHSITIVMLLVCISPAFADNSWSEGADINGDGIVDYKDFAIMAKYWLTTEPNATDITWIYIDDLGVSGHEGFTGYMSKYETTNAQYVQYLNAAFASGDIAVGTYNHPWYGNIYSVKGANGPYSGEIYYRLDGPGLTYNGAAKGGAARINWTGSSFTVDSGFENHPVTYVSWYGSTAFASYYGWRLPTEWEWQAVADYDGSYTYGCGTTINNSMANYRDSIHPDGTTIVGAFGTYGYGIADMAGNMYEWTSSLHNSQDGYRVLRGGSWYYLDSDCTVSHRCSDLPFSTFFDFGFRVCCSTFAVDDPWNEEADINGDGIVDYKDFAIMAKYWLASAPPDPDITWVDVNDLGIGDGHEGFVGQMSKYETTNDQYAQYLNSALASGDIYVDGNYVRGADGLNIGSDFVGQVYYYLAGPGWTYNGATNGGAARINWTGSLFTVDSGFEDHPVTYLSWYGATAFASYYSWRLPTEWEWQAVADYNGSFTYGSGTTISNNIANYFGSTHPHGTTPVGHFGTYGYGMADMAGNVWEWTSSLLDSQYILRILCSGGWNNNDYICTVSNRNPDSPNNMNGNYGFRVCR